MQVFLIAVIITIILMILFGVVKNRLKFHVSLFLQLNFNYSQLFFIYFNHVTNAFLHDSAVCSVSQRARFVWTAANF